MIGYLIVASIFFLIGYIPSPLLSANTRADMEEEKWLLRKQIGELQNKLKEK